MLCSTKVCVSQTPFITLQKATQLSKTYKVYSATKTSFILDSLKSTWLITRLDTTYHTNAGNCKNTNGCTVQLKTVLKLNAISGKLISKKNTKEVFANYE
jgi:hypothetical protein